tara:strand:+ start:396 stop:1304 length:909 start_codon:yes stop_codon:yes gene_type:complete
MCPQLGKEGGSPIKGAGATAGAGFALDLFSIGTKHSEKNRAIAARNREKLNAHERNRWKYHRDYKDRVWKWGNENINREIAVDEAFAESVQGLADSQLKVWQSLKEGTLVEQEAFAAMMSVGGGEQTGARSGASTKRREAVIAYGNKMNQVAAARSGGRDAAMLYADEVRNKFANAAHKLDIESGTSRPVYGAPPVSPILEEKASIWSTLLDVGKAGLNAKMQYDKLKAPEDNTWVPPENPNPPPAEFNPYTPPAVENESASPFSMGAMLKEGFFQGGRESFFDPGFHDKQVGKSNLNVFKV